MAGGGAAEAEAEGKDGSQEEGESHTVSHLTVRGSVGEGVLRGAVEPLTSTLEEEGGGERGERGGRVDD